MGAQKSVLGLHPDFDSEIRKSRGDFIFKDGICKLMNFKDLKVIDKKSVSDSVIIMANYEKGDYKFPVVIKAFYDPYPEDDPESDEFNLLREVRIYTKYIQYFLDVFICPFFVNILGFNTCNLFKTYEFDPNSKNFQLLERELKRVKENSWLNIEEQDLYSRKVNIMVVEKAVDSITLREFLESDVLNGETLLTVFFQILYVLYVLKYYKIVHNDLHPGNIFIKFYKKPTTTILAIGDTPDKIYKMSTTMKVKFFDWDKSFAGAHNIFSKEEININLTSDLCETYGTCFAENYKRDLYLIMCTIRLYLPSVITESSSKFEKEFKWYINFFDRNVSPELVKSQREIAKEMGKTQFGCFLKTPLDTQEGVYIPPDKRSGENMWMSDIEYIFENDVLIKNASIDRGEQDLDDVYRTMDSNNIYAVTTAIRSKIILNCEKTRYLKVKRRKIDMVD